MRVGGFDELEFDNTEFDTQELYNVPESSQPTVISNFISYRKPLTDNVYYFNATSSEGERKYTIVDIANQLGEVLGSSDGFYCYNPNAYLRQDIDYSVFAPVDPVDRH